MTLIRSTISTNKRILNASKVHYDTVEPYIPYTDLSARGHDTKLLNYIVAICCEYRGAYHIRDKYGFWFIASSTDEAVNKIREFHGKDFEDKFGCPFDYKIFNTMAYMNFVRPTAEIKSTRTESYLCVTHHIKSDNTSWAMVDPQIYLNRKFLLESEILAEFENVDNSFSAWNIMNSQNCPDEIKVFLKMKFAL